MTTPLWESLYSTQDAFAVLDTQRRIVFPSGGMEALFNYTREELGSVPIERLLITKGGAHPPAIAWRSSRITECLGLCKGGRELPIELTINPITHHEIEWLVVLVRPLGQGVASSLSADPAPRQRRGRVLIVDDDAMVCSALRRMFSSLGQDVIVMHNAEDALQSLREGERYDLILSDVEMTEMTGTSFLFEVERSFPQMGGGFVLMTGGSFSAAMKREISRTKALTIEKPFDRKQLQELLNRYVC
jgi:CheY-like chemotaxis protein